jgi:hypothetical protein
VTANPPREQGAKGLWVFDGQYAFEYRVGAFQPRATTASHAFATELHQLRVLDEPACASPPELPVEPSRVDGFPIHTGLLRKAESGVDEGVHFTVLDSPVPVLWERAISRPPGPCNRTDPRAKPQALAGRELRHLSGAALSHELGTRRSHRVRQRGGVHGTVREKWKRLWIPSGGRLEVVDGERAERSFDGIRRRRKQLGQAGVQEGALIRGVAEAMARTNSEHRPPVQYQPDQIEAMHRSYNSGLVGATVTHSVFT